MDDKKLEILERVSSVFVKYGIKSVTMDDLARELGISKKTIYKYFNDKGQLVKEAIDLKLSMDQALCLNSQKQSDNAIEDIIASSNMIVTQLNNVNPSIFIDLKKFYPEQWEKLNEHKWTFVLSLMKQNIERGKEEGLYDTKINTEIISRLYVSNLEVIMNGSVFSWPDFKIEDLLQEMIQFFLKALVNDSGRKILTNNNNTND